MTDVEQTKTDMDARVLDERVSAIDVRGDVTAASESALMDAYNRASGPRTGSVVLNFSGLDYMNSGGIGLLVTLLVRAKRQKQRLLASGLNQHYRQILELTRLDEAIEIFATEDEAVAAARGR
ncbi:MAG: STAS domain-containing protein [Candidatus Limnocylindria bacterium]